PPTKHAREFLDGQRQAVEAIRLDFVQSRGSRKRRAGTLASFGGRFSFDHLLDHRIKFTTTRAAPHIGRRRSPTTLTYVLRLSFRHGAIIPSMPITADSVAGREPGFSARFNENYADGTGRW